MFSSASRQEVGSEASDWTAEAAPGERKRYRRQVQYLAPLGLSDCVHAGALRV